MKLLNVPVIDIAPFRLGGEGDKRAVARAVDQACRDIGFLVIRGHGVAPELIARTREVSRAFFDLPLAEKARVARPSIDVTRGYTGVDEESLARSRDPNAYGSDLNESFMIGPVDPPPADYAHAPAAGKHFAPNIWPERPAELREVWTGYYRAMGSLAELLMRIFAMALELPERYFDDKVDRHISRLRVRNYPAQATPPKPGQIRAGAHSDYGSLTILAAEDKPGGLQVCNAAGEWVDVPILPDCFIINIGDLLARWTNDTWVSTLHRVVNPPLNAGEDSRRQSLVFFHNPNYDAVIDNLIPGTLAKYPPTTSGEHLRALYVATQNA
ncbi:isopenicillin N synthase family dioxygenase [Stutzerimonas azotifigens]|uniref:isopenicillin N synthase family dioxygenase n=1 Tax=Stutzerimonas azotifigens TaxID=291995 RepID=UPI000424BAE1|nr:2-oxoglutarate and iron-dependent oxygenase domain-containing protein [Stutzerimonas azotifigens]